MKFKLVLILSIFAITLFGQHTPEEIVKEIKSKYAPDKRVAIFDVEVSKTDVGLLVKGETNIPEAKEELLKKLSENGNMKEEVELLPSKDLGDKVYGVINLSVANLRSNLKHSAEMATQALLGTPVKIYKKRNSWYRIQTPEGYIAWVDGSGVQPLSKENVHNWVNSEKIIFLTDYGFSYTEADRKSQRVSDLVAGNILKLVSVENGFYKVEYPDGRSAFVPEEDAMNFEEWYAGITPTRESIIAKAKTYMGIPYLWGGTSAKGLDCSGFTKTVYFLHGFVLPRDASQQVFTGDLVTEEVDIDKLIPGDLLFFGRKAKNGKRERVTHVALYIGDTEYIHAAGRVKVNSLDSSRDNYSEYRYKTFIRAKRVIDAKEMNGITKIKTNSFYTGEGL